MTLFLLVYLSLYCLAHYYLLRKIRAAFSLSRTTHLVIIPFMAIMVAGPGLVRLAEMGGYETGARIVAYAGYTWMGLLFLFVTLSGAVDIIRFILRKTNLFGCRPAAWVWVSPRRLLTIEMLIVAAAYGYGLFEAADIRLEHVEIASPKIPEHPGRIRVVQISDVHLGLIIRGQRLDKLIARIESANPDILVSTGDLVDGQLNHLAQEAELLAALNPPLGKIAVTGNHEFYAGLQNALDFTGQAGFTILRHQGMTAGTINLVGVDDRALRSWSREPLRSERDLLLAQPRKNFTILLKHRPDIDPESLGHFDLQLSGHTHKGQIFPFNLITWLAYPQQAGQLTPLESGWLYLSRGAGTWGPPIRLLAPPEITIIDLLHGP